MKVSVPKAILFIVWLAAAAVGIAMIANYEGRAGHAGDTPQHWPGGQSIPLSATCPTLILFTHPQCPCTRASMEELNQLLARNRGRVAASVVFYRPGDFSADWVRGELWKSAVAMPGVTPYEDVDGVLARKFGAETSGYVVLYDQRGELLFHGGITAARGHIGDNAGQSSLNALLSGQQSPVKFTAVYGCSLMDTACETNSFSSSAK